MLFVEVIDHRRERRADIAGDAILTTRRPKNMFQQSRRRRLSVRPRNGHDGRPAKPGRYLQLSVDRNPSILSRSNNVGGQRNTRTYRHKICFQCPARMSSKFAGDRFSTQLLFDSRPALPVVADKYRRTGTGEQPCYRATTQRRPEDGYLFAGQIVYSHEPKLSDAEGQQRKDDENSRYDPEPDYDLRLVDILGFVMVMEGSHQKQPLSLSVFLSCILEI